MVESTSRAWLLGPLLVLPLALAACGDGGGGSSDAGSACSEQAATITLSGGLSGTRSAGITVVSSWQPSTNVGTVGFGAQDQSPFVVTATFTFMGEPRPGTYADTDANVECALIAPAPGSTSQGWIAAKTSVSPTTRGTCSLTLTSVTTTLMAPTVRTYCVHGSAQGTLIGDSSGQAQGTVALAASF